jgi:DnaJ-domain-containing protein 1
MDEAQIEAHRRRDTVWQRPTWPVGGNGHRWQRSVEDSLRADFADVFEEGDVRSRRLPNEQEKALSVLDLNPEASFDEIRARYKKLAKKLHPDANGGDPETEERLKAVNQAYAVLRDWRG